MSKEIWKHVKGYKGYYEISNLGNIRSVTRTVPRGEQKVTFKGVNLKTAVQNKGYEYLTLYKHSKGRRKYIHRLVAEAFIPNPKNKPQVNHIDCIRLNNNVTNLEWVTPLENSIHATIEGSVKCGEDSPNARFSYKDIEDMRRMYEDGLTQKEIAIKYNIKQNYVSKIVNYKIWKYKKGR